jgi:plasmid maintenance system antidote protein VapI
MHYDIRSTNSSPPTIFGVECSAVGVQNAPMLSANELLTTLRERGVTNADIQRVLGLPSSRVSEMFTGKRRLQLDEAKKLVERLAWVRGWGLKIRRSKNLLEILKQCRDSLRVRQFARA